MHQRQGRADSASRDLQRSATGHPMDTCHGAAPPSSARFFPVFFKLNADACGTLDAY
jgi:hypothetical protein